MEELRKKNPWYKKWWVWLIIVLVLGAIGSMNREEEQAQQAQGAPVKETATPVSDESQKKEPESEATEPAKEEAIVISAIDLWNDYDKNEVSADQKYKGKQLEVSGKIRDIGKDILDSIYITLETDDVLGSVQVYFSKKEADSIAALSKGQTVTVVGKGDGFTLITASIKNASIK